jgi:hypothetical protein
LIHQTRSMTIFTVLPIFICALIGLGIERVFCHTHGDVGCATGIVVGFLFVLTPYPARAILGLFDFKKRMKARQYDKDEENDSNLK